jgi:hypothetical protein
MNEGNIPPTSRLQTFWLFCYSTERKTHKRRDREAQKLEVKKEGRQKKKRRGRR